MRYTALFLKITVCMVLVCFARQARAEKTITFSGWEWTVKNVALMGPGPNAWDENNVWVDDAGRLHLKISERDGKWQCAELYSRQRFGFGRYQWQIVGRTDNLDPQIVLGLFPYTRPDVGPDGTNEIDIEFTRWGKAATPIGNFSVWPAVSVPKSATPTHAFDFKLDGDHTTNRFDWSATGVEFWLLGGHRDDDQNIIAHWKYAPDEPRKLVPQNPLPLHINFWLFRGAPPPEREKCGSDHQQIHLRAAEEREGNDGKSVASGIRLRAAQCRAPNHYPGPSTLPSGKQNAGRLPGHFARFAGALAAFGGVLVELDGDVIGGILDPRLRGVVSAHGLVADLVPAGPQAGDHIIQIIGLEAEVANRAGGVGYRLGLEEFQIDARSDLEIEADHFALLHKLKTFGEAQGLAVEAFNRAEIRTADACVCDSFDHGTCTVPEVGRLSEKMRQRQGDLRG